MKAHGHLVILGACLVCVVYGVVETLMGHLHHAWVWFTAALPGAQSARLALLARHAKEGE